MTCQQELCPNWSGDGSVCPCAVFGIHQVTLQVARRMGALNWYRCVCSCGSRSPMHGTKIHVQKWGERHIQYYSQEG